MAVQGCAWQQYRDEYECEYKSEELKRATRGIRTLDLLITSQPLNRAKLWWHQYILLNVYLDSMSRVIVINPITNLP